MIPLLALALALAPRGLARPPAGYLDTGAAHVPLTISSWCLGNRCGAPIAASRRVARVRRGGLVRCVLAFEPTRVTVSVGGARVRFVRGAREVDWRATRAGGVTVTAIAPTVWVTYVGRLELR